MPALSRTDIANLALARLPAGTIASWEENSLEAREVRRVYPQVMSDILEGPADFSFATRRVQLASIASTREREWQCAYQIPADMASPVRIIPDLGSLGLGLPIPLPGDPYGETWSISSFYYETPYIISGSTIYTNTQNAILEYQISDVDGVRISSLAATAIELALASRLAVPVKKDSNREAQLMAMAEVALSRAIADDRNRQPEQSGQYLSEAMIVRGGNG